MREIVTEAKKLNLKHTGNNDASVNYVCIFSQSEAQFEELQSLANKLGNIAQNTNMGPVFLTPPLTTEAGILKMLKIRRPDPKRTELGDADFTISDYETFKNTYLGKLGWNLIVRPEMEMLELIDPEFNVLVYYSNPTLAEVLKLDI